MLILWFVKVLYNNMLDVVCFSEVPDLVGDEIRAPTLSDFMLLWLSYNSKAKVLWKEKADKRIQSYCPTRQWSK